MTFGSANSDENIAMFILQFDNRYPTVNKKKSEKPIAIRGKFVKYIVKRNVTF